MFILRSGNGRRWLQHDAENQPAIPSNEEKRPLCHSAGLASLGPCSEHYQD